MMKLLKKNIFDSNTRNVKKYRKLVNKINALEPEMEKLSDDELRAKTEEFKQALQNGKTVEDIRVEAFAVVREASKRVLGMRHYDVQLIGGLALAEGNIAEMATGEGKTLVASAPSYLRALEGKGVHVITVNDYLAKRDRELIGQIHEFLGLTVGLNLPQMPPHEKKAAYQADITYGIGTEFGFDYLRDNMVMNKDAKVQRPYHYALIDEIDSVLIDEAKTPLIIAGKSSGNKELRKIASKVAKRLKRDEDYQFDSETKTVSLLPDGIDKVEDIFSIDNLFDLEHQPLYHYVIQAVRAEVLFEKDVDYIIKDGKIELIDQFTGRVMEGRSLSDGLHQAIEAKENLELTDENKTYASVTIQNYFRMYPILSGMTGTAKTEEKEFLKVYNMEVITIPTNKPKIRIDMPDVVYQTIDKKYEAVTREVLERHKKGQPVLVGTTSILQSEKLAELFEKAGIPYQLLNAKNVENEAALIAKAGQKGMVTISTNMAGRGTDILLGEGVAELGGLHVIGTERHESRRVDNQLKGRAGRQGDPGSSQFFISLEDDMFVRYAHEKLEKIQKKMQVEEDGRVVYNQIDEFVDSTQKIVEGLMYQIREYNLKLDDVINSQRYVIYKLRDRILESEQLTEMFIDILKDAIKCETESFIPEYEEELDSEKRNRLEQLLQKMLANTELTLPEKIETSKEIEEFIAPFVEQYIDKVRQVSDNPDVEQYLRNMMLATIDRFWTDHLEAMTRLREGIGYRQYQQEDPMRIYEKEGFDIFQETYNKIQRTIANQFATYLPSVTGEEK
ncbi:accessory Sec system translocase SecA2 [Pallidibacillus pasinlerensis]|uniref:Protein translocase subunit SecA n=1 Tax=Pallidibacillus pasinlerensis TaxID=2703818 RepID=A0ABX0A3G6_9BACI|nr:accessory Sec system translocase SecA2 [Pallidibacillus pasinlerensis]NCU17989.1 accessory Sec system translocase SecA2 [Pallidibacillus pasinlerensis]